MNQPIDPRLETLKQGPGFTKDREETTAELVEENRAHVEREIRSRPGHVRGQTDDERQGVHVRMNQVVRKKPLEFESREALLAYIDLVIRSVGVDFGRKEHGRPMPPTSCGPEEDTDHVTERPRLRPRQVALSDEMLEALEGREPDPSDLPQNGPAEDERLYQQFKDSLPRDIHNIWEWRFQHRMSWEEIGRQLNDKPDKIRMRFARGVTKARNKFQRDA